MAKLKDNAHYAVTLNEAFSRHRRNTIITETPT